MEKEELIIFNHVLVPKHVIVSEDELKQVLSTYRIKPYQLPRILLSDPAVKALNAKAGDVIKIVRKSETAGEAIYYRYVV